MKHPTRTLLLCVGLLAWPTHAHSQTEGLGTNTVPTLEAASARSEQIRSNCIVNRRRICGRVLEVTPTGLVVESGYTNLFMPPFNHDWLTPANASVPPRPNLVEGTAANSIAVGLVFLTDIPRRPKVHQYDYVTLIAYPAGQHEYAPMPGIKKSIRRFAGGVETAVRLNMQSGEH